MSSENYRCYRLDEDGRLHFAKWFSAESDEQAIEQIQGKHPNAKCEIWQGKRLVAKLSPSHFSPDDLSLQNAVGAHLSALALRMNLGQEA